MNNNDAILTLDIGTSKVTAVVAHNDLSNRINILGVGSCKSEGINKGSIIDIDQAANGISEAIHNSLKSSNAVIQTSYVSVSSVHTKSVRSTGAVNIQSGQITTNEINQVLQMALYNAKIVPNYEVIHVLPLYFKIDDSNEIINPINMHGSRLEVYANVVTAKKTALVNIQNILKKLNIDDIKFVLNGYATAISLLEDDQKKLGVAVVDLGGSTSELTIFKGQSIVYNDFLPIGSENISHDLSILLHTPYQAANMIKNQYGTLLPLDLRAENNQITKVKIPILGNETENKEIPLVQIQPIIHARVEELLFLLKDKIKGSGLDSYIDGGLVMTGGLTNIQGIDQLARKIFTNIPIKIANPFNIQNGYIDFNSPTMSTTVGLLLYALDNNPNFELDSNQNLRHKIETKSNQDIEDVHPLKEIYEEHKLEPIPQEKGKGFFNSLVGKLVDKFGNLI